MPDMTVGDCLDCIKASLARLEYAVVEQVRMNADAGIGPGELREARQRVQNLEAEFGWQWKNVKVLIEKGVFNESEHGRTTD